MHLLYSDFQDEKRRRFYIFFCFNHLSIMYIFAYRIYTSIRKFKIHIDLGLTLRCIIIVADCWIGKYEEAVRTGVLIWDDDQ